MDLTEKHCVPCEGGTPPIQGLQQKKYLAQLKNQWDVRDGGRRIFHDFKLKNFVDAMRFADKIGAIAEAEGHHPEMTVGWGHVGVELWTHAINGLSENDFILAAKIEQLLETGRNF